MSKIVRERYENGALIELTIEGSNFKVRKWLTLFAHLVIAISLAVLAAVAVHDSLALGSALLLEETSAPSCEQSGFRSESATRRCKALLELAGLHSYQGFRPSGLAEGVRPPPGSVGECPAANYR